MGTSGSRTGKYSESGQEWTDARRALTAALSSSGDIGGAIASFARAAATPAAKQGLAGDTFASTTSTAQRLGSFLAAVASVGPGAAAEQNGLQPLDQMEPAQALFALAELVGEMDGSLASSVSYAALSNTMQDLMEEQTDAESSELLEWLATPDGFAHLLETFIAHTIESLFLAELGDRLENAELTPSQADAKTTEINAFIREHVRFSLQGVALEKVDWLGREGQQLIQSCLDDVMRILRAEDD